jgi:hypothetical protein
MINELAAAQGLEGVTGPISEKLIIRALRIFPAPCKNDFVLIFKAFEANPALSLLFLVFRSCADVALLSLCKGLEMHVKA